MNRYHLVHTTEFHYDGPVSESCNEVRLRPMSDGSQSCLSFQLTTTPPSHAESYEDAFGNQVHQFNVLKEHVHLKIETDSVVLRLPGPEISAQATLEQVDSAREELREEFYDYLVQSNYVPHLAALGDLISAAEYNSDGTAFGFSEAASRFIHEQFESIPGATHVRCSIEDTLRLRAGVCQDLAHLLLGVARRRGIPARYVSGYLVPLRTDHSDSELDEVIVGLACHAWVEVYIPGCGWKSLDPTLGKAVGSGHVRIGYGRDYGDVVPVRGVYKGRAGQRRSVDVQLHSNVDGEGRGQPDAVVAAAAEETTVVHICPRDCALCGNHCMWCQSFSRSA